ncbi:MAG: hypothetical protein WAL13_21415, partial [Trebonia sp.]
MSQRTDSSAGLGVGMVGYAFMGRAHSLAWNTVGRVSDVPLRPRLAAICGRDKAATQAAADRFGWAAADGADHVDDSGAAPGRRALRRDDGPVGVAGLADAQVAVEPVRVGNGQRGLGAGDLDEARTGQRRVPAEQQRRGLAADVLRERRDVGGHGDAEGGAR